jgi:hypothetical protein
MGSVEESPASHSNGTHFIDEELNSVGKSQKRLKKSDPASFVVPDGKCFISSLILVECGHPACNNPSEKSKEYSQTGNRGPIMRHWCSEHKFCSKCQSFEEAGKCPKVKQSNYNPNNPSSNPFSNVKVIYRSPSNFPSKLMGLLVGIGQYSLTPYSLLLSLTIRPKKNLIELPGKSLQ